MLVPTFALKAGLPGNQFAFWVNTSSFIALVLYSRARMYADPNWSLGIRSLTRRQWSALIVLGLIYPTAHSVAYFTAVSSDVTLTTMMNRLNIFIYMAVLWIVFHVRDRWTRGDLFTLLICVGLILAAFVDDLQKAATSSKLLMLLAQGLFVALCSGTHNAATESINPGVYRPVTITLIGAGLTSAVLFSYCTLFGSGVSVPLGSIHWPIMVGVFANAIGFVCLATGLRMVKASKKPWNKLLFLLTISGPLTLVQVIWTVVWVGESISHIKLVSLIMFAVVIAVHTFRKERAQSLAES